MSSLQIPSRLSCMISTFLMTSLLWMVASHAQPSSKPKPKNSASKSEAAGDGEDLAETKMTDSGKIIEFKQLNLEGTVQKPSAAFLQGRKKIEFKGLAPKKSFIGEIKKSVKKYPF